MAITFDTQINLTDVKRYDSGTTSFIALDVTDFDLFDSGAEVGDYMQFWQGTYQGGRPWHDLYLSISTPLSMDATLTWYYYGSGSIWKPLTITADGTSGFTASGTIEFDIPTDDLWNVDPSDFGFAIKCEITAFTSFTTAGHVDTQPLVNNWTIGITGTETMASILAADIAGGWGVVDYHDNVYQITSHFYINGNLTSLNEVVKIGETNMSRYFNTGSDCVLQLGEDVSGRSRSGSTWIYTNNSGSYPWMYFRGSLIMYGSKFVHYFAPARDLAFQNMTQLYMRDSLMRIEKEKYFSGDVDIIDSIIEDEYRIFINTNDSNFDNAKFVFGNIWSAAGYSFTLKNCDLSTTGVVPYGAGSTVTLEDCITYEPISSQFNPYVNGTGIVKFNLNLTIQDINGNAITDAYLTITDNESNTIYDAIYSGGTDILLQTFKLVEISHAQTLTYYNPFTLTITKDGYQEYETSFDVTEPINWNIALMSHQVTKLFDGTILYAGSQIY